MSEALLNAAAIIAAGMLPKDATADQMRKAAHDAVTLARLIVDHEYDSRQAYEDRRFDELLRSE